MQIVDVKEHSNTTYKVTVCKGNNSYYTLSCRFILDASGRAISIARVFGFDEYFSINFLLL